jgi:type IV secretory pathway VirB3-like protein
MSIMNQDFEQHCVIDMMVLCGANCDSTQYYVVATPNFLYRMVGILMWSMSKLYVRNG